MSGSPGVPRKGQHSHPTHRDVRQVEAVSLRVPPRYCEAPGCSQSTFHGKPYCGEHLLMNPRAAQLGPNAAEKAQAEIDDAEDARCRRGRHARCNCGALVPPDRRRNCSEECKRFARLLTQANRRMRNGRAS